MDTLDFLVRKDQLSRTELRTVPAPALDAGQVRLRVDKFALTANNITYAAFGDAMSYWGFYPAEDGWGRIPAWGFADVIESRCSGISLGERFYGYYPMSSAVVLQPIRLSTAGFSDGAAHRAALHAVYNSYLRCSSDPFHTAQTEDQQALLRPLFITSWLIDDFLADNNFFGANDTGDAIVLLSSASSKTAWGTAFMLAQRKGIEVVGLTSAANVEFCKSLGCYHRVLDYGRLEQVAADAACIYVDFSGNAALRKDIHTRFANLKYSSSIGGTHIDRLGSARDLPGPRATLFFAPAQIKKRSGEWGADLLGQRLLQAWQAFLGTLGKPGQPWLVVKRHQGPQAVSAAYADVLAGRGDPRLGHILALN
ncbi:MAG: DUF2855 family protein [Sterolibacteriaceae bacterium]|uniref:DUF2855 family protein n=1 Tax=Sulfuritalea sp. TaxID=2480090 RepID=UPI001A3922E2|nr:DUF2855 family protein [Sulfuritalea sp.]MBL8479806.1 DUF2855 family protein [Sterolibacteriaceae bacterium]MBN8475543.1 DUF2855 family protein [Sulfuritalea sp.]